MVTTESTSDSAHRRNAPVPGNFASVASSTIRSAAAIMACLIGASTAMLSTTWPDGRTPVQLRNAQSALTCVSADWVSDPTNER